MYDVTWIVVLNWNGVEDTLDCLGSLKEVISPSCRILVVDNGSTDRSIQQIRESFGNIEMLLLPTNIGYAAANNAGFRRVMELHAAYVIFLNNDTIVDPGFLVPLVETLQKKPSVGIAVPKIFYRDRPDTLWYAGGIVNLSTGLISHVGLRKKDSPEFNHSCTTGYATGCCLAMRSSDFEAVGGFDETFRMYAEDVDLSLRIGNLGMSIEYVPSSRVWHKVSASFHGNPLLKLVKKSVGIILLLAKYRVWSGMVCYVVMLPLRLAGSFRQVKKDKDQGTPKTRRRQNAEDLQNRH
ncbi:MAG: glycosyltransferase family 2 protein [Chlorobium sp.]|jgi:GT2 family glycosyltransferase|nr:MAG: glycosyltransferase family 2 protein [Chlorobium sp.]